MHIFVVARLATRAPNRPRPQHCTDHDPLETIDGFFLLISPVNFFPLGRKWESFVKRTFHYIMQVKALLFIKTTRHKPDGWEDTKQERERGEELFTWWVFFIFSLGFASASWENVFHYSNSLFFYIHLRASYTWSTSRDLWTIFPFIRFGFPLFFSLKLEIRIPNEDEGKCEALNI